jgi:hypothetical protein
MHTEEAPARVLEIVQLLAEGRGQLAAADQLLEGLVNVQCARDELAGAHGAPIRQFDAAGLAAFHDDVLHIHLRLVDAARRDEGLHEAARQIERAALAQLVAALQIKGADDGAHGAGLRHGVREPGAKE